MKKILTTKNIALCGLFAAVMIIFSQIQIPTPSGVPITLQTFAVALIGTILGGFLGGLVLIVYIILGAIGIPVFANFKGGLSALIGPTGGFIFGFPIMALLCGISTPNKKNIKKTFLNFLLGILGLLITHLLGIFQFSFLSSNSLKINNLFSSALLVSFPYLIKDIISVILGILLGLQIRKALIKANLIILPPDKEETHQ